MNKHVKRIVYDTLGVLCLIGALLVGWLPGPGGVPLILAGLGLLSVHHDWAKRLLHNAKTKGTSFYTLLFPDNKIVKIVYDIIGIGIAVGAILVINAKTHTFVQTIAIAALLFSFGLLITNRKRLEKLANFVQQAKKRKH